MLSRARNQCPQPLSATPGRALLRARQTQTRSLKPGWQWDRRGPCRACQMTTSVLAHRRSGRDGVATAAQLLKLAAIAVEMTSLCWKHLQDQMTTNSNAPLVAPQYPLEDGVAFLRKLLMPSLAAPHRRKLHQQVTLPVRSVAALEGHQSRLTTWHHGQAAAAAAAEDLPLIFCSRTTCLRQIRWSLREFQWDARVQASLSLCPWLHLHRRGHSRPGASPGFHTHPEWPRRPQKQLEAERTRSLQRSMWRTMSSFMMAALM